MHRHRRFLLVTKLLEKSLAVALEHNNVLLNLNSVNKSTKTAVECTMAQGLTSLANLGNFGGRARLRTPQEVTSRRKYCVRVHGLGSLDAGSEDEDVKLTREFESQVRKVDPQSNAKLAQHLNLLWSVSEVSRQGETTALACRVVSLSNHHQQQLFYFSTASQSSPSSFFFLQKKRPEKCECCAGSGERECFWCHGTGAMTIGDTIFCSEGGCQHCPVCNGSGQCRCDACKGTGKRAAWMSPGVCKSP